MADDDKEVPTESTDDEIPVIEEGTETFEVEVEEEARAEEELKRQNSKINNKVEVHDHARQWL